MHKDSLVGGYYEEDEEEQESDDENRESAERILELFKSTFT